MKYKNNSEVHFQWYEKQHNLQSYKVIYVCLSNKEHYFESYPKTNSLRFYFRFTANYQGNY